MSPKKAGVDKTSGAGQLKIDQVLSQGSVAFTVDVGKEFESYAVNGKLNETINEAFTYCAQAVGVLSVPFGNSCPARTVSEVRQAINAASGKRGSAGGLFGGCLGFLALGQDAIPQSTDVGKIGKLNCHGPSCRLSAAPASTTGTPHCSKPRHQLKPRQNIRPL